MRLDCFAAKDGGDSSGGFSTGDRPTESSASIPKTAEITARIKSEVFLLSQDYSQAAVSYFHIENFAIRERRETGSTALKAQNVLNHPSRAENTKHLRMSASRRSDWAPSCRHGTKVSALQLHPASPSGQRSFLLPCLISSSENQA